MVVCYSNYIKKKKKEQKQLKEYFKILIESAMSVK